MAEQSNSLVLLDPPSPDALLPATGWWPWLAAAVAVLLVAGLVIFMRRRKPAAPSTAALREAAFAAAAAALTQITSPAVRDAAVLCSLILRQYLTSATGDPALYETHDEFTGRHDALTALTPEARAATAAEFDRWAALKYAPPDAVTATDTAELIEEARQLLTTLHHGFAA